MQDNQTQYSIRTVVRELQNFFWFVVRRWWLMFIAVILGAGIAFAIHSFQKPKYEAICTFILEEKTGGASGLAGLASQFGFEVGGMTGGGGMFAGDNIMDILKSKKIIYKVLLSKIENNPAGSNETLADLFLAFSGWNEKWKDAEMKGVQFGQVGETESLSSRQDSVLGLIHHFLVKKSIIAERLNKKGSIIKVKVSASNSFFARLMTDRLVDEATRLYLDVKTGTAMANITQMQRRSDSLLYLLNRKSFTVATSAPLDANPGIKAALVPVEIATRDKSVLATLYAEVTKNLEANKLLLSQQTPIIQILDRPGQVIEDSQTSLTMLMLLCSLATVFVCTIYCLFRYYFSQGAV